LAVSDPTTKYATPTAVVTRAEAAVNTAPSEITHMLQLALDKGVDVGTLERLVALHERVTDRAAAAEFAAALADFQDVCPSITKGRVARVSTSGGSHYSYNYADLSDIARTVRPLLHSRGFSYSWDSSFSEKLLSATCVLRHTNGHKESATFACPVDSKAGMSEQQKFAAALTYAKRMALIQVLGITTADPDTDGGNPETISQDQADELRALATEVSADEPRFLAYMGVAAFEDIMRSNFNMARTALESKRRGPRGGR
jgi:hypothetical protein